jgi:hypothetical protein
MSKTSKSVIPILRDDQVAIKIRMNYGEIATIINNHDKVFLRGLNTKEASYAHKRLEMLCKCKLDKHAAILSETNEEGYYFEKIT